MLQLISLENRIKISVRIERETDIKSSLRRDENVARPGVGRYMRKENTKTKKDIGKVREEKFFTFLNGIKSRISNIGVNAAIISVQRELLFYHFPEHE